MLGHQASEEERLMLGVRRSSSVHTSVSGDNARLLERMSFSSYLLYDCSFWCNENVLMH